MMEPGWWLTQFTTVLVAGLGLGVLWVRPHTAASRALGWLLVCYGTSMFGLNISNPNTGLAFSVRGPLVILAALAAIGLIASATALVASFPARLPKRQWTTMLPLVLAVAVALIPPLVAFDELTPSGAAALGTSWALIVGLMFVATTAGIASLAGAAACLALRHRALPLTPAYDATRRQLRIMAAGLYIPAMFTLIYQISVNWTMALAGVSATLFTVVVIAPWLWAMHGAKRPQGPRNVAWLAAAVAFVSAAMAIRGVDADNLGIYGFARLAASAILAYGVLRAQMLGLDIKVRFAVRGTTMAAIFVGVFFVVAEAAQQFFGERSGNEFIGILAAGGLVFAFSPLQRLADRVAARAVPHGPPQPSEAETLYRNQAELAWMDGAMTRREGLMLRGLAQHLRLPRSTVDSIDEEAMRKARRPR